MSARSCGGGIYFRNQTRRKQSSANNQTAQSNIIFTTKEINALESHDARLHPFSGNDNSRIKYVNMVTNWNDNQSVYSVSEQGVDRAWKMKAVSPQTRSWLLIILISVFLTAVFAEIVTTCDGSDITFKELAICPNISDVQQLKVFLENDIHSKVYRNKKAAKTFTEYACWCGKKSWKLRNSFGLCTHTVKTSAPIVIGQIAYWTLTQIAKC